SQSERDASTRGLAAFEAFASLELLRSHRAKDPLPNGNLRLDSVHLLGKEHALLSKRFHLLSDATVAIERVEARQKCSVGLRREGSPKHLRSVLVERDGHEPTRPSPSRGGRGCPWSSPRATPRRPCPLPGRSARR